MARWIGWWRHAALAGGVAGLLLSAHLTAPAEWLPCASAASLGIAFAGREVLGTGGGSSARAVGAFLFSLAGVGALIGFGLGSARVEAIDAGALSGRAGDSVEITGFVEAVPRRSFGEVRVQVKADAGRVAVVAPEPVADLPVGSEVRVRGSLSVPDDFRAAELARIGAEFELHSRRIVLTGAWRGGVTGVLDRIRLRAERALGVGMSTEQAALARGFVLGQDDRIDPVAREEFRRSGLSHLLAVSGQNVMLLAVLAGVVLALVGLRLRSRLLLTIAVIAIYVPVAGGGPSIQRAGVMGAAAIVATFAGRPTDRAYPPLLAAVATLLINPRFSEDVGWQLSFAAVIGIILWAGSLRDLIRERLGGRFPEPLGRGLSDGIAITLAATVATAPLIAHDFERLSLASIPANLLALPAVAPVMWVGMLIGLLGQFPGLPPAALGLAEGALLDYIAWVARTLGTRSWSEAGVSLPAGAVIVIYLLTSAAVSLSIGWLQRRRNLGTSVGVRIGAVLVVLAGLAALVPLGPTVDDGPSPGTLSVIELDVGQGDATLLQPPRGDPVLVDAGPLGGGAADALADRGIDHLRAVVVTHQDLDHSGGLFDVLESVEVDDLIRARPAPRIESAARSAGVRIVVAAEGSSFRFGAMSIDALWPPREHIESPVAETNDDSLVLAVRFGGYDALLTGDAESEVTHLDPGPFDVLKVAHHGSDDAGLSALLDRSVPRVALIGVGADNTYGHPTEGTLQALADHGVCTLRTDLDGDVTVELGPAGVGVETERGSPQAGRPGCS